MSPFNQETDRMFYFHFHSSGTRTQRPEETRSDYGPGGHRRRRRAVQCLGKARVVWTAEHRFSPTVPGTGCLASFLRFLTFYDKGVLAFLVSLETSVPFYSPSSIAFTPSSFCLSLTHTGSIFLLLLLPPCPHEHR